MVQRKPEVVSDRFHLYKSATFGPYFNIIECFHRQYLRGIATSRLPFIWIKRFIIFSSFGSDLQYPESKNSINGNNNNENNNSNNERPP